MAREAGLGITVHAGELAGWESVAAALDHLRPTRIGHGVRAIENSDLVARIADEGVVLEICPVSNIELKNLRQLCHAPVSKAARRRLPRERSIPTIRPISGPRWSGNTRSPPHISAWIGLTSST